MKLPIFLFVGLLLALGVSNANAQFELVKQLDPFSGGNRYGDVWGDGNYAYVGSFNGEGVGIFDISDPENAFLATQYTAASNGRFKDIKVSNGVGYFASDNGGGVHLVDLSDPTNPTLISQITSAESGFNSIHNLFVSGNFLYQADGRTTVVKVFDISDASAPTFVRDIATTDTTNIHDITVVNDRLYTSGWSGTTDIYDVGSMSLTQAPTLLGTVSSGSNTHASWASDDGTILVSAREINDGDIRIFDISDPSNPSLLASIDKTSLGVEAFSPHNPVIVGDTLYVSWYAAGMQAFDISDPSNPLSLGSFDTKAISGGGLGNWGVYPFLGPDKILLSDGNGGLFIVRSVPEPSSLLFLMGIGGVGLLARRRRR